MNQRKFLFIDRDGTLIKEPEDKQVDSLEKFDLMSGVIPALLQLIQAGYTLIMISNQDGLGSLSFPYDAFSLPHQFMLDIFASQGINFEAIRICPHLATDGCDCRKPKIGLVLDYVIEQQIDRNRSFVIGDRETDLQFAENLGIKGIRIGQHNINDWQDIAKYILSQSRTATMTRTTKETSIAVTVDLDNQERIKIDTGIGFFNHMLEQLAKHGGFNLSLQVAGDIEIDDHHTVEDTAIVLGEVMRKALGDKWGIHRYGFVLPMDEALASVAIDLSGRSYFKFNGKFNRESVGDLSTELVPHFFRTFCEGLKASLHIEVSGDNNHHMIESIFKCVGRSLRQAIQRGDNSVPTTKGVL